MAIEVAPRRFTVDEYERLGQAGVLTEDERVELIDGEILAMNPIGARHAAVVKRLMRLLSPQLAGRALLSVQDPIVLDDRSEPRPDLALLRPRGDEYETAHPTATDVLLVIEVADTTVVYDSTRKLPLYARSGIQEAWLVDLVRDVVQVHQEPTGGEYRAVRELRVGDTLTPGQVPGIHLSVGTVLKRRA